MIHRIQSTASPAAGGAGVATVSVTVPRIRGEVIAVYLSYLDSPPAGTTDITLVEKNNSPAMSILSVTNAATSGWFFPRAVPVSQANAAITDGHVRVPVDDELTLTIAQANDGDGITATIVYDDLR